MIAALVLAVSWAGAWGAAPSGADMHASLQNVTLREIVRASIGGTAIRVRLSNRFGDAPIAIAAVSVARAQSSSEPVAAPASMQRVTFSGSAIVTIPAHADVISDDVALPISAHANLLVSIYVAESANAPTYHHLAYQESFAARGNRVDEQSGDGFSVASRNWYFLDGIDVTGSAARGTIVALGDSITNGQGSTVNGNDRWTDALSDRFTALPSDSQFGIVNEAIDGDRILLASRFGPSALARFDDDVVSQSGAAGLIILLGINDIQQSPHQYDAAAIEFGLVQLAERAHMHGLRVVACTITPYEGWVTYAPAGEQARTAVNTFLRSSRVFDGVADFDAAVRDPHDPHRLRAAYDSGDHLHPNAAAYKAMANAVDLAAFSH
jgi:lysophospholipase L1-like esterase